MQAAQNQGGGGVSTELLRRNVALEFPKMELMIIRLFEDSHERRTKKLLWQGLASGKEA